MTPLIVGILMLGGGPVTQRGVILTLLVVGAVLLVGICWETADRLIKHFYGRNWPTVSAVIDTVSVTVVENVGISSGAIHNWPYYLATLTYSYPNPEPHTGDYKRKFGKEDDAKAWADSYKGETVKVHVDPRDPTRSVLRDEDL